MPKIKLDNKCKLFMIERKRKTGKFILGLIISHLRQLALFYTYKPILGLVCFFK